MHSHVGDKGHGSLVVLRQKRLLLTRAALDELRKGAAATESTETK